MNENINAVECVLLEILTPSIVFRWKHTLANHNRLSKFLKIRGYLLVPKGIFPIQRESMTHGFPSIWKYLIEYNYSLEQGERRTQAHTERPLTLETTKLATAALAKGEEKGGVALFSLYIHLLQCICSIAAEKNQSRPASIFPMHINTILSWQQRMAIAVFLF